jgi:SAM-dependent methyltransferase
MFARILELLRGARPSHAPAPNYRNRGIAEFEFTFGREAGSLVVPAVEEALARGAPVRVLEIGCGEGRLLLELRRRFPDVALHGINKKPFPGMNGSASLAQIAIDHGIFTRAEVASVRLPEIAFHDASELRLADASADLVLSHLAIQYVVRKDRVLEEVWRVLKPGGRAFLNLDSLRPQAPEFLQGDLPRFAILEGDGGAASPLSFTSFIERLRARGFDVACAATTHAKEPGRKRINVVMRKNTDEPLCLGLDYDAEQSVDLKPLRRSEADRGIFWGHRSVYRVPPAGAAAPRAPSGQTESVG